MQTCRELADRHLANPTPTVKFEHRGRDGWIVGVFSTTWFAEDGKPPGSPAPAHRVGSDAHELLGCFGYPGEDVDRLIARQIVGAREFANTTDS